MKAEQQQLLKYIKSIDRFDVPRYQRPYSWSEEQCELLWNDIMQAGENGKMHFLGCIICINDGLAVEQPVLIIDGQQRVLTMILLLEAMARSIDANDEKFDNVKSSHLREIIGAKDDDGNVNYKITFSGDDQKHFDDLVNDERSDYSNQSKIIKNFDFFLEKINKATDEEARNFHKGLLDLQMVAIFLDDKTDNPQQVFEDMNFKGERLGASDLVRNHMLMDLSLSQQERLHKRLMLPLEACLRKGQKNWLEDFLIDYLVVKRAKRAAQKGKAQRIYDQFREFHQEASLTREGLLKDMKSYSGFYSDLVEPIPGKTPPYCFMPLRIGIV